MRMTSVFERKFELVRRLEAQGFVSLRRFLEAEAARTGLREISIYYQIVRGRRPDLVVRKLNRKVVLVKPSVAVSPADSRRERLDTIRKVGHGKFQCECGQVFASRNHSTAGSGCPTCRELTRRGDPVLLAQGDVRAVKQEHKGFWYGPTILERGELPGFGSLAALKLEVAA